MVMVRVIRNSQEHEIRDNKTHSSEQTQYSRDLSCDVRLHGSVHEILNDSHYDHDQCDERQYHADNHEGSYSSDARVETGRCLVIQVVSTAMPTVVVGADIPKSNLDPVRREV